MKNRKYLKMSYCNMKNLVKKIAITVVYKGKKRKKI